MRIRYLVIVIISLVVWNKSFADETDYCNYTTEKSQAEKLLYQMPSMSIGFGRNSTATSNVLAVGINESLSKFLKGNLSGQIGENDCKLYRLVNEIQKHVLYDLTKLTIDQATQRIEQINIGVDRLNEAIDTEKQMVVAGSSTALTVLSLQGAKAQLEISRTALQTQIASTIVPDISLEPLDKLIVAAKIANLDQQELIANQAKYDNWDLSMTAGVGSDPGKSLVDINKPFVSLNFTYSFGTSKRNDLLTKSSKDYATWTNTNKIGPIVLAQQLHSEVQSILGIQTNAYASYMSYAGTIQANLDSVKDIDTATSHAFKAQLLIAQINSNVEVSTSRFTIDQLHKYDISNFGDFQ